VPLFFGAYGANYAVNKGAQYLVGKKVNQLHIPMNVALVTLGITTFFIYMYQGDTKPSQLGKEMRQPLEAGSHSPEPAAIGKGQPTTPPQTMQRASAGGQGWGLDFVDFLAKTPGRIANALGRTPSKAAQAASDTFDVLKTPAKRAFDSLNRNPNE